jgi:hypothetical protein
MLRNVELGKFHASLNIVRYNLFEEDFRRMVDTRDTYNNLLVKPLSPATWKI